MTHWLEKAESEAALKRRHISGPEGAQLSTAGRIRNNYETNGRPYENFRSLMACICERVNQLPAEYRAPWNYIDAQSKGGNSEQYAYGFSSCRRFESFAPCFQYPFLKRRHHKCIRKIRFAVSREMGKCDICIRDERLVKVNMAFGKKQYAAHAVSGAPAQLAWVSAIARLDRDFAYAVIDWLAFKTNFEKLLCTGLPPGIALQSTQGDCPTV